jgi:hypothetical protein
MQIPDTIKAQLPPWNSLEGIEDARKMCQAKLIALEARRTLYLLEALYCEDTGWTYLCVCHRYEEFCPDTWEFGAWSELEIETFKGEFLVDPFFTPCLLGDLTTSFQEC